MTPSAPPAKAGDKDVSVRSSTSDHIAVLAALDFAHEERQDRSTAIMLGELIKSYWPGLKLGERRTIAKSLAGRTDIPRELVDLFLSDHFTIANLAIDASPLLDDTDLRNIADSRVMPMIRVMARRALPDDLVRRLAALHDTSTALSLALNRDINTDVAAIDDLLESASDNSHVARALTQRANLPLDAEIMLFPEFDRAQRERIILRAERDMLLSSPAGGTAPASVFLTDDQRRLFTELGKRLPRAEFLQRLNGAIGLKDRTLQAMLAKDGGSLQAIVFAGLGFSAADATTLFIVLGSQEERSYTEIRDLLDLFERVKWRLAGRFLAVWTGSLAKTRPESGPAASLQERADSRAAEARQSQPLAARTTDRKTADSRHR